MAYSPKVFKSFATFVPAKLEYTGYIDYCTVYAQSAFNSANGNVGPDRCFPRFTNHRLFQ